MSLAEVFEMKKCYVDLGKQLEAPEMVSAVKQCYLGKVSAMKQCYVNLGKRTESLFDVSFNTIPKSPILHIGRINKVIRMKRKPKASGVGHSNGAKKVNRNLRRRIKSNESNIHIKSHGLEDPLKCTTCGKCFSSSFNLRTHLATHSDKKPFRCNVCHMTFKLNKYLKPHMKLHDVGSLYSCKTCPKSFPRKCKLRIHMLVHSGLRPYSCGICHKRFKLKWNLVSHTITCHSDQHFECDTCGKSFNQKCRLQTHIQSLHSSFFPCELCGDVLNSEMVLMKHVAKHCHETLHHCIECNISFKGKRALLSHNIMKHRPKPEVLEPIEVKPDVSNAVECLLCGDVFQTELKLMAHVETHF